MADPIQPNWLTYILGVLMALLAWIGATYTRRIDKIERTYISRDELKNILNQTHENRLEMHRENLSRLDGIDRDVDRINDKFDRLLRDK